jgi:hypothetical protein
MMPLSLEAAAPPVGVDANAMQRPGHEEEPLSIKVLASAAGVMEIEDSEPLTGPSSQGEEPGLAALADSPTAPQQIHGPDSRLSPSPPKGARGSHRLRRGLRILRRYRPMLLLAVAVIALLAGGSYACVAYRSKLLAAGAYIRRHAPLSAVYYALIVALWIVLCLPSTIIELGASFIQIQRRQKGVGSRVSNIISPPTT